MMSGRVTSAITAADRRSPGRSTDRSRTLCAVSQSTSSTQSVQQGRRDDLPPGARTGTGAWARVRRRRFCCDGFGTTALRCLALGARMPWYLTRLPRGRGTNAVSWARNSIGSNTTWVVPLRYGIFSWQTTCPAHWYSAVPAPMRVTRKRSRTHPGIDEVRVCESLGISRDPALPDHLSLWRPREQSKRTRGRGCRDRPSRLSVSYEAPRRQPSPTKKLQFWPTPPGPLRTFVPKRRALRE